jgi:hypothetical protein
LRRKWAYPVVFVRVAKKGLTAHGKWKSAELLKTKRAEKEESGKGKKKTRKGGDGGLVIGGWFRPGSGGASG